MSLSKKPSFREINKAWENDALEREQFSKVLTSAISNIKEPFVISITASFGTGKSFFLNNWAKDLEDNHNYKTIKVNAWKSDFDKDPFIPLLSIIIEELNKGNKFDDEIKALQKVIALFSVTTSQIITKFTGYDAQKAAETVEDEDILYGMGKKISSHFIVKKDLYETIEETLKKIVKKIDKPLVVFVDELDRCRPDYSIEMLECIKHLFHIEGIIFVLGVDEEQLIASVQSVYGINEKSESYLRKFIDWNIKLPAPNNNKYAELLFNLFNLQDIGIFKNTGKFEDNIDVFNLIFAFMSNSLGLSLREQSQCYTNINFVFRTLKNEDTPKAFLTATLATIYFKHPHIINDYIINNNKPEDFFIYLEKICNKNDPLINKTFIKDWEYFTMVLHTMLIDSELYYKYEEETLSLHEEDQKRSDYLEKIMGIYSKQNFYNNSNNSEAYTVAERLILADKIIK